MQLFASHFGPMRLVLSGERYQAAYRQFLVKLRQARTEAGMSQIQVAQVLGKPQSFMSKIETGERRLDFVELQILAVIYGKDLSYFVPSESV